MADIIDLNIYPVIETVDLTIAPNLTTININTVTGGGGAVTSVNGLTGDVVLNQDSVLDGTTYKQYSLTEKNKLAGIAAGAEVNVNADWNATTGDAQILNKPTIPSITGLELQANKQNSLATDGTGVKYPTVDAVNSGLTNINTNAIDRITVKLSVGINKGQAVYVSSADGTNIIVAKASNTTEATSSKTIGLLETTGATNAIVNVVTSGLLAGLNTSTATVGDPVWLGVSGDLIYGLTNKPFAPAHLVYIGVVTRVNVSVGEILVNPQNGFELKEIHDVLITSVADKQLLSYDSTTSLWKNKSVTTADIASSTDKNYVTDAQATVISNTSGTNTGDQDLSSLAPKASPTFTGTVTTPAIIVSSETASTIASFDASKNVKSLATATYPSLTELSYGKGVTSAIQPQLDNRLKIIDKTSTPSTTLTGTLTETQVYSLTIPANTFTANDVMVIRDLLITRTVGTSTTVLKVKLSTSATMPSGTTDQIAIYNFANVNAYAKFRRSYAINGGNIVGWNSSNTSTLDDSLASSSVISTIAFNPAVTNYLYVSLTLGNITDSASFRSITITN